MSDAFLGVQNEYLLYCAGIPSLESPSFQNLATKCKSLGEEEIRAYNESADLHKASVSHSFLLETVQVQGLKRSNLILNT